MTEMKFFAYGSMSEGLVHFHKIRDFVTESKAASIQGTAYRLKVGYPVVLQAGTHQIPGQLLTLKTTDLLIHLLDEFHGFQTMDSEKSLYQRQETSVSAEGAQETAWIYFLNPQRLPKDASLICDGDWKASLQSTPPLTEKLTERQRQYVLRLGSSTGREIVPIDLPLYRELMNLEMIVDKGRRLALSKTGHEVFRYLS